MQIKTKQEVDLGMNMSKEECYFLPTAGDVITMAFSILQQHCHAASYNRGWWHDPVTGLSLIPDWTDGSAGHDMTEVAPIVEAWFPYIVATKIALIHSEVSEMLEAHRTGSMDDKIPQFPGIVAEGADVVIRLADLIGMMSERPPTGGSYELGEAIMAKLPVNASRPDHDILKRLLPGAKRY